MMPEMIMMVGMLLVMLFFIAWISVNLYKKCPPNTAMIITGMMAGERMNAFKIVVGGGAVVLPLIQQINYISLEMLKIAVITDTPLNSMDNIPLFVTGTAQIKVKGDDVSIMTAAEVMLGKDSNEVQAIAEKIIVGSLRQTVASLTASDVVRHPEIVVMTVQELALAELAKMGLTVVTFSITDIRDQVGYLDLLAREQVERKRKEVEALG
jgi:flotillin